MSTPVRENVLRMHPYQPGKPISTVKRELGLSEVVKLASNENPFGPSPKAIEAIKRALGDLNLYPDGAAFDFRSALAARFGFPMEQIVVGNGSDELIGHIALALIADPQDEILTGQFSFPRYDAAAELAPCRLVKVPLDSGWRFDLKALLQAVTERTRIIYLANPNNPTGTIVSADDLSAFIRQVPDNVLVVMDEAYFEFAVGNPAYPDGSRFVREGKNVACLRTFSKAHGLAGVRVGYGFVPAYLAEGLERVRAPFNLNSLAQEAGLAALDDDGHVAMTVRNNAEGLAFLKGVFEGEGCSVTESYTNFHFVDLKRPAGPVFDALMRKGFIVRPVGGATNHLRVTIGTADQNRAFATAFHEVMNAVVVV